MFCAEMDGIESLQQMVIILASNRADLIDPAILRPGRIDRKIKVCRPDRKEAEEIYRIYLTPSLPFAKELLAANGNDSKKAVDAIIKRVLEEQFDQKESNRFLEVVTRSGRHEFLYRSNLISGAIISSIVERAKETAIKRTIGNAAEGGLRIEDFLAALDIEYRQNDIFPPSDITEDWLKLIDQEPDNVVKISPVKPRQSEASSII
jgi:proteasome-associated ATPase